MDEKRSIKGPIFSLFQNDPRVLAVLPGFINNLQGRIQLMKEAVDKNDWEQLLVLSHKLKGTAGNYGYPQLSKLSGLIEEQTVEKKLNVIMKSLCELEDLGRRILDAEVKSKLA
ncbi:MAG: Hpt domain-containing protein [Bdellovibrionota bacterium]